MKITYIFFGSVYGIFILFVSIGSAANYTFTCDKPHRNDNVIGYKVYYRLNSGTYDGEFERCQTTDPKFDRVKHTGKSICRMLLKNTVLPLQLGS